MIVKVLSSLKHNGTKHEVGKVFDLDEKYVDQLKGVVEPVDGEESSKASEENEPQEVNLENKNRKALNKIAKSVGIKNPEGLDTRQDVIDAIEEAQDDSPNDPDNEDDEDDDDEDDE